MKPVDLNSFDKLVSYFSPAAGLRRINARRVLSQYEAAVPSRLRKSNKDHRSPDLQVQQGAVPLRNLARNLEQNHDIARGILRTLVNNVVGPAGIGIEPQPRKKDGSIHTDYAKALRDAWRDWCLCPEVTQRHHWTKVQRMMAKSWFRDGECFSQLLTGPVPLLDHGTRVPFSMEMFEADMVPMDYHDLGKGIYQGVQRNVWGKPTGFWVWKTFPNGNLTLTRSNDLKYIESARMLQLASVDRIGQMRGVSEFASVITRLEDIKDYEESERIAAKIAAALTAFVKKGSPDLYEAGTSTTGTDASGNALPRELSLSPGTIIDNLGVGEEIGLIDSNRPNPNVVVFRQGQLRAVAAGIGGSYSSIARDYAGTYSAQRQELVEQWIHYAVLTDEFVGQFVQPVWKQFVLAAHLSGQVRMPSDLEQFSEDDCLFVGQSMPWIDPLKEASAWHQLVQDGFASEVEVIRKRGGNPRDVMEQIKAFREEAKSKELVFGSDMANEKAQPAPPAPPVDTSAQDANAAAHREVMAGIAAGISALAAKSDAAQTITVTSPEIHNHIAAPQVTVEPPEVNVAAPQVTVEAPQVTVEAAQITVPAAQVVMQHPSSAVQTHERDPKTQELISSKTEYKYQD
jgi:lambda family phage portal protein